MRGPDDRNKLSKAIFEAKKSSVRNEKQNGALEKFISGFQKVYVEFLILGQSITGRSGYNARRRGELFRTEIT